MTDEAAKTLFEEHYRTIMSAADRYFGLFGWYSLVLAVHAWLTGVVTWRSPLAIACLPIANVLATRVIAHVGATKRTPELLRHGANMIAGPIVYLTVEGPLSPWWPSYLIFTLSAALITGLSDKSKKTSVIFIFAWALNAAMVSILFRDQFNFYQSAYLVGSMVMISLVSLEWMNTTKRALDREAERTLELKQERDRTAILHQQLLEASRQAGMAEVAAGILHNIGNVLNTVNISVSLIEDMVQKLPTKGMANSIKLIESQPGGLNGLVANPQKALQFVEYLRALTKSLAENQAGLQSETSSLVKTVEHIKGVVQRQQEFVTGATFVEEVDVQSLIADVLNQNRGLFQGPGIELHTEVSALPKLRIDKHRLIQILVNLGRNAVEALAHAERKEKLLWVRARLEADLLIVEVQDNGIGIAPENLEKMFQFGFTTRKDGHGFGLHSCANAATEMGGKLACMSGGLGQGAKFILTLPVTFADQKK
jgi:signal transduction histidine kinase